MLQSKKTPEHKSANLLPKFAGNFATPQVDTNYTQVSLKFTPQVPVVLARHNKPKSPIVNLSGKVWPLRERDDRNKRLARLVGWLASVGKLGHFATG